MADASATSPGDDSPSAAAKLLRDIDEIAFVEIVLIVLLAWASVALAKRLLTLLAEQVPYRFRMPLLGAVPISKLCFVMAAVVAIIPLVFEVTLQNLLIIGGAISVALGFAFKDLVSSLSAGVLAVIEKPFRPGDWVELSGHYGEVIDVGLRATLLRTPDDTVITVPNATLWTDPIGNANDGATTLMCVVEFHLAPPHDAEQVRAALDDVVRTSPYLDYDQPILVITEPTPFATRYRVKGYPFDMRDQFVFATDIAVRGKAAIATAGGVEISAPAVPDRGSGRAPTPSGSR